MLKKFAVAAILAVASLSCFAQIMHYPAAGIVCSNGDAFFGGAGYGWGAACPQSSLGTVVHTDFVTLPTSTACGTTPTVTASNTGTFEIVVGSSPSSTCAVVLPTAVTGWRCTASDITHASTIVMDQTLWSTTGVTMTSYVRTTGAAGSMTGSDVLLFTCAPL